MSSDQPPAVPPANQPPGGALSPEEQRLQFLLITATDHEVITRTVECFRGLFAGNRSEAAAAEFTAVKWLLHQKLPEHFAYEERHVFPALLAANPPPPVAAEIAALSQEHAALLEQTHRLNGLLARCTVSSCTGDLWLAVLDFCKELERHSMHEDELLLQILKQ